MIQANKFFEVQKYLTLTNHQYNPQSVIFSKKVWDTLSPAEKKIARRTPALEAAKFQRQVKRDAAAGQLDELKKAGMQVTEFSPAEQAKLRDKLKPVIDKHGAAIAGHRGRAAGRTGQAAQVSQRRRPQTARRPDRRRHPALADAGDARGGGARTTACACTTS